MRNMLMTVTVAAISLIALTHMVSARSCDEIAQACIKNSKDAATIPKCKSAGQTCKTNGGTFYAPSGNVFRADAPGAPKKAN